jgi:hypothetical protein
MGALLVYFAAGSIISVPVLAYHLLRTRRELSELRTELQRRGVIGGGPATPSRPAGIAAPDHGSALPEALPAPPGPPAVRTGRGADRGEPEAALRREGAA